ncbi:hypothetical protein LTR66_016334 [Elasticomyces elasticus]|nr:hypothetical protein LTR66_016334 [Elasticomyces elasticus]
MRMNDTGSSLLFISQPATMAYAISMLLSNSFGPLTTLYWRLFRPFDDKTTVEEIKQQLAKLNDGTWRKSDFIYYYVPGRDYDPIPAAQDLTYMTFFDLLGDAAGYSIDSVTTILSLAVYLVYIGITLTYLVYILIIRRVTISWNTPSDLFMLALNSRQPDHIASTSAGVNTLATFREPVGIMARTRSTAIEVVFRRDAGWRRSDFDVVGDNEAY